MQNERQATLWRLRCAEGHIHAVIDLLEAGCDCEKALAQLAAVHGAIERVAERLFKEQAECCKQAILDDPSPERRCAELGRLVELYKFWLNSNLISEPNREEVSL